MGQLRDDEWVVTPDGRGRVLLPRRPDGRRAECYLVRLEPDGVIVLIPAKVVPAREVQDNAGTA